jgi:hypothetical protein
MVAPTASAPVSPSPSPGLGLAFEEVGQQFTTPLLDVRTDGEEIIYSSGAADGPDGAVAPDLYRLVPGGQPERILANPDRDSSLLPIAVAGGHYAFVELNDRLYGTAGWGVWYLGEPGAEPLLLDQTDAAASRLVPKPQLALSDDYLVWQTFSHAPDGLRSELRMFDLRTQTQSVVASALSDTEAQYWFPSLDGSRLVYTFIDYSAGACPCRTSIELMDLKHPEAGPQRLNDGAQGAVLGVIAGDSVVWKASSDVFNWGQIVHLSLTTGEQTALNYPSLGNRFVAAWGADDTKFYVYDLEADAAFRIAEYAADGSRGDVRPAVSGDLMAWIHGEDADDLYLRWTHLPP